MSSSDQETNEVKVNNSPKSLKIDEFETINGRLSMISNHTKYVVTVDEIKRRMGAPESLNSSSLAGLLRRSKTKNCGEDMRAKMKQHGIEIDLCRRKTTPTTSLTGLCEGEIVALCEDMNRIASESFPSEEYSQFIIDKAVKSENVEEVVKDAQDFLEIMEYASEVLNSLQPPISSLPVKKSEDPELNQKMDEFSLHTHGFGILTHQIWEKEASRLGTNIVKKGKKQIVKKEIV